MTHAEFGAAECLCLRPCIEGLGNLLESRDFLNVGLEAKVTDGGNNIPVGNDVRCKPRISHYEKQSSIFTQK